MGAVAGRRAKDGIMDRRLLMVMGTSLLVALALSAIFYQVVAGARKGGPRRPARKPGIWWWPRGASRSGPASNPPTSS